MSEIQSREDFEGMKTWPDLTGYDHDIIATIEALAEALLEYQDAWLDYLHYGKAYDPEMDARVNVLVGKLQDKGWMKTDEDA